MFTNTKCSIYAGQDKVYTESVCLSTDVKPTTGIANGSTCIEMNTGKKFMFNEDSGEWVEVPSSGGGGGGGGGGDFSTAQVTVQGDGASEISIIGCFACHVPDAPYEDMMMTFGRFGEALVLYKGVSYIQIDNPQQKTISVSGNIEEATDGEYFVTGDCTITVTA